MLSAINVFAKEKTNNKAVQHVLPLIAQEQYAGYEHCHLLIVIIWIQNLTSPHTPALNSFHFLKPTGK